MNQTLITSGLRLVYSMLVGLGRSLLDGIRSLLIYRSVFFSKDNWAVFGLYRTEIVVGLGITEVIENYSVWV